MLKRSLFATAFLSLAFAAQAQTAAAPAAASSPGKKEAIAKILELQKPGIEAIARNLVEQPASQIGAAAGQAVRTQVPADKREAMVTAINGDLKKYADEAVPLARERAVKLAPSTIGKVLDEKMTEDELKQVITIMQSPAFAKYQNLQPEMQQELTAKLVAETRPLVEPKIKVLDQTIAKRLGIEPPPATAAPAASGAKR